MEDRHKLSNQIFHHLDYQNASFDIAIDGKPSSKEIGIDALVRRISAKVDSLKFSQPLFDVLVTESDLVSEDSERNIVPDQTVRIVSITDNTDYRLSVTYQTEFDNIVELSADLFGGVLINNQDFDSFMGDYTEFGMSFIRIPGGTFTEKGLVEDGEVIYADPSVALSDLLVADRSAFFLDLTFPELINPALLEADKKDGSANSFAALSDLFAAAIQQDCPISVILPVRRYYSGVDLKNPAELDRMMSLAEEDLRGFLERVKSGAFNDGKYPENIIFEIGNENYSTPLEHALFSRLFIDLIDEVLGDSDIAHEIAFQMNIGSGNFVDLLEQGYFDTYFDENGNALVSWLEGLTFDPGAEYSYAERILIVDQMMAHIVGESLLNVDKLRHHFLALDAENILSDSALIHQRFDILDYWLDQLEALGGDRDDVEFFVSAWTVDSSDVGNYPAGLAAAGNILLATQLFLENGVDLAAAWGFNGSDKYWPENSPTTALTFTSDDIVTPAAEVFRLLSENAVGHQFLTSSRDEVIDADDPSDYREMVFWTTTSVVIFYTAGYLDGATLSLEIDLSAFGHFTAAQIVTVGTVDGEAFGPVDSQSADLAVTNDTVTVTFDQSHEIVMLTLENEAAFGTDGDDLFEGNSGTDVFFGGAGADVISGWNGDDRLHGEDGADTIYGNGGNDEIHGGVDADRLRGGDGADLLYGGTGADNLDGQAGDDILFGGDGSDRLFGGDGNDVLDAGGAEVETVTEAMSDPGATTTAALSSADWWLDVSGLYDTNYLDGGAGDDTLIGSKGADEFVFSGGHDTIEGFQPILDKILFAGDLFDQIDIDDVLSTATQTTSGIVFQFDEDASLTLSDMSIYPDIDRDLFIL